MFSKSYELSLNKNYVSHWGLIEAVRELIQNAIDSDSPFVYSFEKQPDGKTRLILNSEFTVLTPQTLLLGSTSKANSPDKIGSFGEGYKIALLVLTRLGYSVDMLNGRHLWKPYFKFNSKYGEELLTIEETAAPSINKGLSFIVYDLADNDVEEIRESCLRMQDHIGAIKITTRGDILLEKPGKLYVGGLFICNTDLKFGYNLKPDQIQLERDRQTVNTWDLKVATKLMWFETNEFDRVAELIEEQCPDLEYAEYGAPEIVKDACYNLFQSKNPGAISVKSQAELDDLVKKGMTNIVYTSPTFHSMVSSSKLNKVVSVAPVEMPTDTLKKFLTDNRSKMQASAIVNFKSMINKSSKWVIR